MKYASKNKIISTVNTLTLATATLARALHGGSTGRTCEELEIAIKNAGDLPIHPEQDWFTIAARDNAIAVARITLNIAYSY